MLMLGGGATYGSSASSGGFRSDLVRSDFTANIDFFTTVKLD